MKSVGSGWFGGGASVSGLVAGACCLGPALGAIGFGGAGFISQLAPYRPVFIAIAAVFLAFGFYRVYRPARDENGELCCPPERLRTHKIILWVTAVIAVVGILLPYITPRLG